MKEKATGTNFDEKKEEWKKKYGSYYELEAEGKTCFVFDPMSQLKIMKQLVMARRKNKAAQVDALLANCWLQGDDSLKNDDRFKLGIQEQVDELFDIPEPEVVATETGFDILIDNERVLSVAKATRMDVAYAEDRNSDNKPFVTSEFLIDRIAVDKEQLAKIKVDNRVYLAVLLAANEVKDKAYVRIKKH